MADDLDRKIASMSDERVINNVFRHEYRVLTDEEKVQMKNLKDMGLLMWGLLDALEPPSREISIAKTKLEEVVMWGVKHITK